MSVADFTTVYTLFMERVCQRLVDGERFQMGKKMGSIYVSQTTAKPKMIDWTKTWEMWREYPEIKHKQYVFQLSENTIYTFVWSRGRISSLYSKYMYKIKTSRTLKTALYKAIVERKKEYI